MSFLQCDSLDVQWSACFIKIVIIFKMCFILSQLEPDIYYISWKNLTPILLYCYFTLRLISTMNWFAKCNTCMMFIAVHVYKYKPALDHPPCSLPKGCIQQTILKPNRLKTVNQHFFTTTISFNFIWLIVNHHNYKIIIKNKRGKRLIIYEKYPQYQIPYKCNNFFSPTNFSRFTVSGNDEILKEKYKKWLNFPMIFGPVYKLWYFINIS